MVAINEKPIGSLTLPEQIQVLADRAEISELIDRYTTLLDTQDENGFDDSWPPTIFTEDVRLEFPIASYKGLDGLAEFHYQAKQKFDRTHHLSSNHSIGIAGDRATVRFSMLATHVHKDETRQRASVNPGPLFGIGGYYEGEAVRTAAGWRFRSWAFHVVWSTGASPAELA